MAILKQWADCQACGSNNKLFTVCRRGRVPDDKTRIFFFSKMTQSEFKTVESFSGPVRLCRNLTSSGEETWPHGCSWMGSKSRAGPAVSQGLVLMWCEQNLIMFRRLGKSDFSIAGTWPETRKTFRKLRTLAVFPRPSNQVLEVCVFSLKEHDCSFFLGTFSQELFPKNFFINLNLINVSWTRNYRAGLLEYLICQTHREVSKGLRYTKKCL